MFEDFFSGMRIVLTGLIIFLLNSEVLAKEQEVRGLMRRNQELLTTMDGLEREVAELKQELEQREEDHEYEACTYKKSLDWYTKELQNAETVQVNLCMLLTGFATIAAFAIWSHMVYTSPLLRIRG